jgi:uncharacterized membrane protein YfcA
MIVFMVLGIFGILTGISASLFGFGGGFVVVPLLYHLLGATNEFSMYIAVATSTAIMIVNSLNATYKHNKKGNVIWHMVFPLIIYIGIGAIIGVFLSKFLNSNIIRWCFIIYMGYTIFDCLAKKHFIHHSASELKFINKYLNLVIGVVIGVVATVLGVGGSVMTVPLMRKLGAKMKNAVAMANPLSFPVGLMGAIGYVILAYSQNIHLGTNYFGFIYLPAFLFLVIGGFVGVPIGSRLINKIPDAIHAKIYILLLFIVLIAMIL